MACWIQRLKDEFYLYCARFSFSEEAMFEDVKYVVFGGALGPVDRGGDAMT